MPRRIAAGGLILAGIALVGVTFWQGLFAATDKFEKQTNDFRPYFTSASIAQMRADVAGLSTATTDIGTKVIPALAARLGVDEATFRAGLAQQYPDVAAGLAAAPAITASVDTLIDTFEAERARFASADSIVTKSISTKTVPWGLLGAGAVALGLGAAVLAGRKVAIAAMVLGALVVAVPFAVSMPSKASDADTLNANLEPVFTAERVQGLEGALVTLGAMDTEMRTEMIPGLAQQLNMTPQLVQAFLATTFPSVAAQLQTGPQAFARMQATTSLFKENLPRYLDIKDVSFRLVTWTTIGSGAIILLAGALAFTAAGAQTLGVAGQGRWRLRSRRAA